MFFKLRVAEAVSRFFGTFDIRAGFADGASRFFSKCCCRRVRDCVGYRDADLDRERDARDFERDHVCD